MYIRHHINVHALQSCKVVIDTKNNALAIYGDDPDDREDITLFFRSRQELRWLAERLYRDTRTPEELQELQEDAERHLDARGGDQGSLADFMAARDHIDAEDFS